MRRYLGNGDEYVQEVTVTPGTHAGTVVVVGPGGSRTVPEIQKGHAVVAVSSTPVYVQNQPVLPVTTDEVEKEIAWLTPAIKEMQSGYQTDIRMPDSSLALDLLRNRLKALTVIRNALAKRPMHPPPLPPETLELVYPRPAPHPPKTLELVYPRPAPPPPETLEWRRPVRDIETGVSRARETILQTQRSVADLANPLGAGK